MILLWPWGRATLLARRESHTGQGAPAAVHHCQAHARASTGSAGGPAAAVQACAVPVPSISAKLPLAQWPGACAVATAPKPFRMQARLTEISAGCSKCAWGPRDAGPLAPAVRKIASAGLCRTRTRGINLIDFSHFHFIWIIMDTGINYSLD